MLKLRKYHHADYPSIKRILNSSHLFDSTTDTKKRFNAKAKNDSDSIIIAEMGKKVVGLVMLTKDPWIVLIWRLSVDPNYRSQGVGTALLREAERIAKKNKHPVMYGFVSEKNSTMLSLSKKLGYREHDDKFVGIAKKLK